jgi:hypothetical protein
LQHPFGHEAASQTHCPVVLLHSCPVAHATHAAPPAPHDALDSDAYASHVPLAVQQPLGHDVASHTHCPAVVLHSWPAAQPPHAAPPLPHDVLVSLESASQVEPLQQPAHAEPPQLHAPPEHDCPEAHALQAAPLVPQSEATCDA